MANWLGCRGVGAHQNRAEPVPNPTNFSAFPEDEMHEVSTWYVDACDRGMGLDEPFLGRRCTEEAASLGIPGQSVWTPVPGEHHVFFVRAPTPSPPRQVYARTPTAVPLERTSSGRSITAASISSWALEHADDTDLNLVSDAEAARWVGEYTADFFYRYPDSTYERILRTLITPRPSSPLTINGAHDPDFELDDAVLASIFSATNEMFFAGRLTNRVSWDWSGTSISTGCKYETDIIGTTAMRKRPAGGYEALIVLSSPILRGTNGGLFSRRLLISTFIHELIHCYLFVCCGHRARECGGHTAGFIKIASVLDDWAGHGVLHLREMEADLERFRTTASAVQTTYGMSNHSSPSHYGPCSGHGLSSRRSLQGWDCSPTGGGPRGWDDCGQGSGLLHDDWLRR
ncbi:hypothetical protein ACKVWC_005909 [Pyricularia oryzae]